MNEVYSQRKWRKEQFNEECKKWLLLMLELVKYDHNPETLLHEFISSQDYVVTKCHQRFIVDQVCSGCISRDVCNYADKEKPDSDAPCLNTAPVDLSNNSRSQLIITYVYSVEGVRSFIV